MGRGLRFRLLGIPVRIDLTFFVVVALVGWGGAQTDASLVVWIVVAFVSILWHELGHAIVFRIYGMRSEIVLHGMGGHTIPTEGPRPSRWGNVLVALAGPGFGLLLGAAAVGVERSSVPFLAQHPLIWTGVAYLAFINVWWSALNLAPLLPLDGGNIAASLLDMVTRGRGRRIALVLSVATAGAGAAYGLAVGSMWIAFLAVLFGAMNLAELVRGRADRREASQLEEVREGFRRLGEGDLEGAAVVGRELLDGGRSRRVRAWAGRLLMWRHLLAGEPDAAEAAVAESEPGVVPVFDQEEVVEAVGGPERGLRLLQKASVSGAGLRSELARALLETGRLDEAVSLVTAASPDGMTSPARLAVALALHGQERFAEAARLFGDEFHRRPSPSLAYDAACACARAGRHEEALAWLARAVEAGFSDRGHLDADGDLDAIRQTPAFQDLRRRISP